MLFGINLNFLEDWGLIPVTFLFKNYFQLLNNQLRIVYSFSLF